MLDKLKEADGIFCSNEPSTLGMLLALKQNNLAGSKKFVGFDTSPGLVEGLKRGEIQALVAQNPKKMGREAVKALVAKMKGEAVPTVIDTGAAIITKGNLDTPEIQALLVQSGLETTRIARPALARQCFCETELFGRFLRYYINLDGGWAHLNCEGLDQIDGPKKPLLVVAAGPAGFKVICELIAALERSGTTQVHLPMQIGQPPNPDSWVIT